MRRMLLLVTLLLGGRALAQVSDAQVLKDSRSPNQKSLKLRPGPGSLSWDYERKAHLYTRMAEARLPTEYPGVDVLVTFQAVYMRPLGSKSFRYWKSEVFENRYAGIPNPSIAEINDILAKVGAQKILGYWLGYIVGEVAPWQLAKEPKWEWHTPMSVSFNVETGYTLKESSTKLSKVRDVYRVRLYRKDIKAVWDNAMATLDQSQRKVLSSEDKDEEEVAAMKTAKVLDAERAAHAELGTVELPQFASVQEVLDYTYEMMRTADEKTWRAYQIAMLPRKPFYFQTGSDVLLTSNAQFGVDQMVNNVIKKQARFKKEFCPKMRPREPVRPRERSTQVYFLPKGGETFCRIVVEGPDKGRFSISDLECHVPIGEKGDEIAAIPDETVCMR
jgi:hypothetical protein